MNIQGIMEGIKKEPYFIDTNSAGDVIGVLYCCDCLEILPQMPARCAMISDPPYGISWDTNYSRFSRGTADKQPVTNDAIDFNPIPLLRFDSVILWGANHYKDKLPDGGTWLVWDKRNDDGTAFLSDGELAWYNIGYGMYIKSLSGQQARATNGGLHPTQKPVALMQWCIEKAGKNDTILDPYFGSGSTLVAAKRLGRAYIGIEIEPRYVEIAKQRLLQMELF